MVLHARRYIHRYFGSIVVLLSVKSSPSSNTFLRCLTVIVARRICGRNLSLRSNRAPQVYQTRRSSNVDLMRSVRGSYVIILSSRELFVNSFPCRCGSKESWNLPIFCIGVSSTFWLCVVSKRLPAKKKRQKPIYSCVKFISEVKLIVDKLSYKHVRFWSNLRGRPGQLCNDVLSKWAFII